MASTDATPIMVKGQAYRATFPIWDADGDLVTGATGLDSEISKDAGTFTDCTNEATEIATSSGIYYLDISSTETNADTVAIIVKTSTSGAKTTPLIFYPQEAGDIKTNVTYWSGTAVGSPATAGYPVVTLKDDLYHADIQFTRDQANTQDEYTLSWFKNGVRVTSGITVPTIQVIKRSDGSDLIASSTPTQIASTGTYKYDATTTARQTVGESVLVVVTATIDAATRSFSRLIGRDSS